MSRNRGSGSSTYVAASLIAAVSFAVGEGTAPAVAGAQAKPADGQAEPRGAAGTSQRDLQGPDSWIAASTGIEDGVAYRLVETVLEREHGIQLDAAYVDLGEPGGLRKVSVGGSGTVVDRQRLRLKLTAALSGSAGTATAGERYIESNASLTARPRADWIVEVSYTDSVPLKDGAVRRHSLDRALLEYEIGRFRAGAGYAGYQHGRRSWEHRPFVSLSRPVHRLGEIELWLQRVERPGKSTAGLQIRLAGRMSL